MQFPNAFKGVSKLFIAEILALIGALVMLVGAGLTVGGSVAAYNSGSLDAASGLVTGGAITMLGGLVLPIIGYIMQLVGLSQASKDEPKNFKVAFIAAIIALIASLVVGFTTSIEWLNKILTVVSGVGGIITFFFSIAGIMELARRMNRPEMVSLGNKISWMVVITYVLSFVIRLIPIAELAAVLAIASAIFSIITYIIFLVYLSRAKKMLAA